LKFSAYWSKETTCGNAFIRIISTGKINTPQFESIFLELISTKIEGKQAGWPNQKYYGTIKGQRSEELIFIGWKCYGNRTAKRMAMDNVAFSTR